MSILQELSQGLAEVVQSAQTHLVRVEARRRLPATGVSLGGGLIVTAHHVIEKEKNITLGLPDGTTAPAQLVGRDPSTDLAVLKTEAVIAKTPLNTNAGNVGNIVIALGRPNHDVQASLGFINALGGQWNTPLGSQVDQWIQTNITMYPGFSGGPLFNAAGEMIGINTSALLRHQHVTIPAATVQRIVDALAQYGQIRRGYLGVSTQTVRLPRAWREQLKQETGLMIVGVESGESADHAGLVLGDILIAIANQPLRHHDDLLAQLTTERIGRPTPISFIRGNGLQSAEIVLSEKK